MYPSLKCACLFPATILGYTQFLPQRAYFTGVMRECSLIKAETVMSFPHCVANLQQQQLVETLEQYQAT